MPLLKTLLVAFALASFCSCSTNESRSPNASLSIEDGYLSGILPDGWRQIPTLKDSVSQVYVTTFRNDETEGNYVISISEDVSASVLSDENYLDVIKMQYGSLPSFEFLDKTEVTLHGKLFHSLHFNNLTAGSMSVYAFRTGEHAINIIWASPSETVGHKDSSFREIDERFSMNWERL